MVVDRSEYSLLVLHAYKQKRDNGEVSRNLAWPTRAKLRDECYFKCRKMDSQADEQLLREFFCPGDMERPLLPLLKNFDPDRLKTLDNFLKKPQGSTDDKNADLLAWLIDFKYRPFSPNKNLPLTEEEITIIEISRKTAGSNNRAIGNPDVKDTPGSATVGSPNKEEENNAGTWITTSIPVVVYGEPLDVHSIRARPSNENVPGTVGNNPTGPLVDDTARGSVHVSWYKKRSSFMMVVLLTGISAAGIFMMNGYMEPKCMTWTGDRYKAIDCKNSAAEMSILPIDEERLKHLQRITRPDTLTERDIGKVFYIKNDNKIEYFTRGGVYPEDPTRYLQRLSRHIYEKYLADTARYSAATK